MKSIFFAGFIGLFLTAVVIGVLSVTPILEGPEADRVVLKVIERLVPRDSPEPETSSAETIATRPAPSPKVLGLQTRSNPASVSTVYGLINGTRRDRDRSILKVSEMLELAATQLHSSRAISNNDQSLDDETVISRTGYFARSFTVLEANDIASNWEIVEYWKNDPRAELLLHSESFNEMGMSILCNTHNEKCTALLILAAI